MIIRQLILQLILIALNAFFAATEIAVISLNEKKVKARAEEGNKKAKKMLKMIEDPTSFLSTIQIGITLAGFLGSAFAADNFAVYLTDFFSKAFSVSSTNLELVNTLSVVVITLILSFFTLVLGELVPKRIAMRHKEKLSEYVCGFISFLAVILKPIIWFLTISTNAVLTLFGIDPNESEESVSEEDIVIMLDAGADEGTLDKTDIQYIKNVFKFDRLSAADIMTQKKNVVFLPETSPEEDILNIIDTEGYSRIPVYSEDADKIIGILRAKDYLLKYKTEGFTLKDALFEPYYIPETMKLDLLFKNMQSNHYHIAVVVNEYGATSGIVTIEDILEELVGEIWDESDDEIEETNITKLSDDEYIVLPQTSIEEIFTFFDVSPDEESESTTVNGWLIEKNGDIPEEGYNFIYENLSITVTKADDIMAHEVRIVILPPTQAEDND